MSGRPDPTAAQPPGGDVSPGVADVPWAGGRALLDGLIIYVGAQIMTTVVAVLLAGRGGDPDELLPVLVAASPVVSLAVALGWLRVRYPGRVRAVAGRRPPRVADVGIGVAVGTACLIGQNIIVRAIAALADQFGADLPVVQQTLREIAQQPGAAPLFVVTTVLLAPLAEEIIFRGVLFQGLRCRTGFWVAALGSAVLFTVPHLVEGGGLLAGGIISSGILPLGVVFAALVERRGSLAPAVLAHATYNAISVVTLILMPGQA